MKSEIRRFARLRESADRSTTRISRSPLALSASIKLLPIKPAPPVTIIIVASLQQIANSALDSRFIVAPDKLPRNSVEPRRVGVTLRNVAAQRRGLQHLDPSTHAHYTIGQLGGSADVHRHDRGTVAPARESLRAMNGGRPNICNRLLVANFKFD